MAQLARRPDQHSTAQPCPALPHLGLLVELVLEVAAVAAGEEVADEAEVGAKLAQGLQGVV